VYAPLNGVCIVCGLCELSVVTIEKGAAAVKLTVIRFPKLDKLPGQPHLSFVLHFGVHSRIRHDRALRCGATEPLIFAQPRHPRCKSIRTEARDEWEYGGPVGKGQHQ